MTSNDDDDDFSPKDAFNMFTPIYWRGSRDRFNVPLPPHAFDEDLDLDHDVTLDSYLVAGVTDPGAGGADGGGPPPDLLNYRGAETSEVDPTGWIFGETTDTVIVPLVLSVIGILGVLANLIVILALLCLRRMRSGPNLMLANLAVADLAILTAAVPTAVVSRVHGTLAVSAAACRFVHYVIFVAVYVAMYTLVVICVFRFFGELLRGGANRKKFSDPRDASTPMPLSICSAVVSSAVIWAAFVASHLTFVVQSDVSGLAAFEEPLICVYGASEEEEPTRARTLWITFLACAFLLPLTIVCGLSAAVLQFQRRCRQYDNDRGFRLPEETTSTGGSREMETTQNQDNDDRGQRQLTILVMASTIVRTICWLPLQIFVLADVFGPEPETQENKMASEAEMATSNADVTYRRKWELFCVCAALTGSCLMLPLLRILSSECRDSFKLVFGRRRDGPDETEHHRNLTAAHRLQMGPGRPCSPSLTASMLHRQRSFQPDNDFNVGHLKQLSPPPGGRLSVPDVNETILSIISDSSNHINYA